MAMSKEDLKYFEILIHNKMDELNKNDHLRQKGISGPDAVEAHTPYSFHMADQGTDNQEREKKYFFATRETKLMEHLERALDRIKDGTYGLCRSCGELIHMERLKAVPHATLCIQCKSKQEKI